MTPYSIILASTSPRRIELMQQVGVRVEVRKPEADETPLRRESPRALVTRLSRSKAASVAASLHLDGSPTLVIAADTIVVAPDGKRILGKPTDAADAEKMLRSLSGRKHTVLTGYCLHPVSMPSRRVFCRVVTSRVQMRKLTREQIQFYISTGEPMDKAGAYAAQGRGMALVEALTGSYTNVVGLPMCQLLSDLETKFDFPVFK